MANSPQSNSEPASVRRSWTARSITPTYILAIAIFAAVIHLFVPNKYFDFELQNYDTQLWRNFFSTGIKGEPIDPDDYVNRAMYVLRSTPLIDGHNDFPFLLRQQLHGQIYGHDFLNERIGSHSDFQNMKEGMMGGQFWSVYVPCPEHLAPGVDLNIPNERVPDINEPNVRISPRISLMSGNFKMQLKY